MRQPVDESRALVLESCESEWGVFNPWIQCGAATGKCEATPRNWIVSSALPKISYFGEESAWLFTLRALLVFRPVRGPTPSKRIDRSLAGLRVTPDCENVLCRRDVVTGWKINLRRDQNMILAGNFFVYWYLFSANCGRRWQLGPFHCLRWTRIWPTADKEKWF